MHKIIEMIENASEIAILSHIDEDADAIGSSLALLNMLKAKDKKAIYYVDKPIEKRLQFLSNDYEIYDGNDKAFDLVICLDSGDLDRLGKRRAVLEQAKESICIDHHYTNIGYCDENLIDGDMSSTSEMVYNLLCGMGFGITDDIAKYLYCGIMGDTGCLKYSCASSKTTYVISKLMEYDFDHADVCRKIFDTDPIELVKLHGYIMNNLESCFEEKTKISLRSNGKYNVGEIAKRLGGGGHEMAAGVSVGAVSVEKAKKMLLDAIGEVING